MRSFILFLKQVGLQKIVGIFIAVVLIIVASIYVYNRAGVLPDGYQVKFNQAKYEESIPEIEKWLESNPQDVNAKELLAALYIQKADAEPPQAPVYLDKALKTLKEIVIVEKDRHEAYRLMGTVYMYKVDYANAEKNFNRALSLSKNTNMNSQAGLAGVFEARGNMNMASVGYMYALKKEPNNEMANLGMGRYYISKNGSGEAVKYAQAVLNTSKNNATLGEAYHILGTAMKITGKYDLALNYFKESLKFRPGNVHTLVLYGEAQIDTYMLTKAGDRAALIQSITDTANKVIALKPDYIHGYTLLYKSYLLQNKYSDANAVGKKIVALLPSDVTLTPVQKAEYKEFYNGEITSVTIKSIKTVEVTSPKESLKLKVEPLTTEVRSKK